jgi:F420-dependent oxidoreductase-like protein
MEFGIYVPQVVSDYQQFLQVARTAEATGFESMCLDHLYTPGAPAHPAMEAWTLMTALLANTTRLRVGALVLCNSFRNPALLARMATTLDVISGGRLEFGLGSGSYEQEHHEAGIAWESGRVRSERLGEALEIITRMFTQERTTFEGAHYTVNDLPNVPQPVQRPRPPIHIGGAGPKFTMPLVARYADVWNVPTYALGEWATLDAQLAELCAAIGRDPGEIRRSHEAVIGSPRPGDCPRWKPRCASATAAPGSGSTTATSVRPRWWPNRSAPAKHRASTRSSS